MSAEPTTVARDVNAEHQASLSLNDRIALRIMALVGNMFAFYAFCILALIPLLFPQLLAQVQFVSSGFLQLVLLPLIIVGQGLLGRHAEARAEEDFRTNVKAEREIAETAQRDAEHFRTLSAYQEEEIARLETIIAHLTGTPQTMKENH